MSKQEDRFKECDIVIDKFVRACEKPVTHKSKVYYLGVDLGTACIVLVVLNENFQPVAGAYKYADVVRDGMVVDYIGAVQLVRDMKEELEEKLDTELIYAAAAIPPGTETVDGGAVRNVVQGAGLELTGLLDESTAANSVLKIRNGAIVDIGGGTTGISVFRDGRVVYIADEPTGGTHFSLVLAGAKGISFEEAETYKRNPSHHKEILPVLKPVIEKVSSIVTQHIEGHDVEELYLVGGTCCLTGIEEIIQKTTGISTYKPSNPMFATPIGIAMNCTQEIIY